MALARRSTRAAITGATIVLALGTACGPRVDRTQSFSLASLEALAARGAAASVRSGDPIAAPGVATTSGATPATDATGSVASGAAGQPTTAGRPSVGPGSSGVAVSTGAGAGSRAATPSGAPTGAGAAPAAGGTAPVGGPVKGPDAPVAPGAVDPTKAPVMLGHIGEYSGVVGAAVGSGLPASGVTVRWLNDHGGLNGHPVKLVTGDSQSDPSRYAALVKQMVERDKVIAFLGNQVPLSAQGAAQYLVERSVPAIGGDLTQELWFQNPMMFPQGSTLETLALGVMQTAARQGKTKMAVFWCTEAEVCGKFNSYMNEPKAKSTGADLVYSAQISLAQPDFTSECLQAQQRGAQAIMLAMDPNAQSRVARSCTQQGYKPLWFGASVAIADSTRNDPNLDGLTGATPTFPWPAADTGATQTFQAAIKQYAPSMVSGSGAAAVWTSGMLLRSIAGSLSANPTSADILTGLYGVRGSNVDGLTSPLTYEKGQPYKVPSCYFLVRTEGGRWVAPDGAKPQCLSF